MRACHSIVRELWPIYCTALHTQISCVCGGLVRRGAVALCRASRKRSALSRVESTRSERTRARGLRGSPGGSGGSRWYGPRRSKRGRVSASLEPPNASEKQLLQLTLSRRLSPQRSAAHRPSRRALTYQHRRAGGRVANPIANTRHVFAGRIAGKQLVFARAHLPHSRRISICTVQ